MDLLPGSSQMLKKSDAKKNLEIRIFMGLPDFRNGGSCGIRTYDQLVKSQLLYQLS
ncbi:hypothetical protein ALQ65_01507 [Pseudomonas syringae pv. coriandricola]|uniref:Uncharacterized protein n=1 Tax=Pseudomonas syringae pv. coriandricola TaxID=264453 RepID=A0A3M3J7X2_9PSED|nr:hypothetical protein ALQ65_01507 [Pseudomonas syringae pv. coriandricola]